MGVGGGGQRTFVAKGLGEVVAALLLTASTELPALVLLHPGRVFIVLSFYFLFQFCFWFVILFRCRKTKKKQRNTEKYF
jgi:hypothetical protein